MHLIHVVCVCVCVGHTDEPCRHDRNAVRERLASASCHVLECFCCKNYKRYNVSKYTGIFGALWNSTIRVRRRCSFMSNYFDHWPLDGQKERKNDKMQTFHNIFCFVNENRRQCWHLTVCTAQAFYGFTPLRLRLLKTPKTLLKSAAVDATTNYNTVLNSSLDFSS